MFWAFDQGKSGKDRLYEETEKAADIGTCAHGMVELDIKEVSPDEIVDYALKILPDKGMRDKAWSAFYAYKSWAKNFDVKIIEQEIHLVSEQYQYGGTPDAIGLIGNQIVLLDWKTSSSVYSDHLIQLAAYEHLWNENNPERPINGGCHLLRFDKDNGDFAHHYYAQLNDEWEQFVDFRRCYERDKRIEKRAA
jgi:hypothetical protein